MSKITNFLTAIVLFSCGISFISAQSERTTFENTKSENLISYHFFKIDKDASGLETISLIERKVVEGKMKSIPIFSEEKLKNGDLLISLSDAEGNDVFRQKIGDPLNPELESFGDEIERIKLKLNEGEFSVRFPYSKDLKTLKIEKINNSKKLILFTQNF